MIDLRDKVTICMEQGVDWVRDLHDLFLSLHLSQDLNLWADFLPISWCGHEWAPG